MTASIIRQNGLPCRLTVVESWDDLQLHVEPRPGWIHLATGWGLKAWLEDSAYHVSVTRYAHRDNPDAWWRVFNNWHEQDVVLWISDVRGGASAVLDRHGPGADEDLEKPRRGLRTWCPQIHHIKAPSHQVQHSGPILFGVLCGRLGELGQHLFPRSKQPLRKRRLRKRTPRPHMAPSCLQGCFVMS